jgi:hypothetical protein
MVQVKDLFFITPQGGGRALANFYLWMPIQLGAEFWQKPIDTPIDRVGNICKPFDLAQMKIEESFVLLFD